MIRNRNGYWMSPKWFALYAPDGGDGTGGEAGGGIDGTDGTNGNDSGADSGDGDGDGASGGDDATGEIARLKAELAKQKAAIDKATKEAAQYKRDLRQRQSAEEIAAEEKKAQDEATKQELDTLRKEVAQAKTVKTVMSRLGTDEETSGKIAEYLYGAEDPENALTEIQKAWVAREKALKLEYGRIPAPGAGGTNGEDAETQKALEFAKEMGQRKARNNASVREQLGNLIR